jgi:8-oxo-dGTP diphosphatase
VIEEFSAGGVLFKDGKVLLIKNPSGVWTLPKGLVEEGEEPKETALREVWEETGIRGRVLSEIGDITYWYMREKQKIKKRVIYYLMEYVEGEPRPSWEVQEAGFFSLEEAKIMLKYKGDKEIFERALKLLPSFLD